MGSKNEKKQRSRTGLNCSEAISRNVAVQQKLPPKTSVDGTVAPSAHTKNSILRLKKP